MVQAKHVKWDDVPWERLKDGVWRRFIVGERVMLVQFKLSKGAKVPMHSHHNEQVSYVLEGALKFVFENNEERLIEKGVVVVIPPYLGHQAEAIEDSFVIDVFTPPREDWIKGMDTYLRNKS